MKESTRKRPRLETMITLFYSKLFLLQAIFSSKISSRSTVLTQYAEILTLR